MPYQLVWAIFFLPLAAFLIISFIIRPFFNHKPQYSSYTIIGALAIAFIFAVWTLIEVFYHGTLDVPAIKWVVVGGMTIHVGLLVDSLSAVMLVVVTLVSLMVQIYSQGYMAVKPGDYEYSSKGYCRYFAFMSLFTASMLGLVIADNLLFLYVFWEGVGLCSYLLIGFWFHKPEAANAAKKAFIVTRIGDFGFLVAILFLFFQSQNLTGVGTFDIMYFHEHAKELAMIGFMGSSVATWAAVGIFAGAVGKSAQFPLHTWLPDAMEGPTPVSALIHAATMVAAGVFLVARFFPLVEQSNAALTTVAITGGFTAVFAATMGLVMYDVRRVLAYSTISQLGYMMLALGVGAPSVAIFHLFNHAFFKALLFLGSGSVNHATGTFDMRYMGGLRRHMPWTYATFVIGSLSLAGIFPLAGFWSKDEILLAAWRGGGVADQAVFWVALASVFLTAFYMFRVVFMTFHGSFRGGADAEAQGQDTGHAVHLAESPWVMVLPLVGLGVAAIGSGYVANPLHNLGAIPAHWFVEFLGGHAEEVSLSLAAVSTVVALLGIGLAVLMYQANVLSPQAVGSAFRPLRDLLFHKYYMDELYENIVVVKFFQGGVVRFLDWVDREVIDRTGDFIGWLGRNTGCAMAPVQNGQVQAYGIAISLGILVIVGVYLVFG